MEQNRSFNTSIEYLNKLSVQELRQLLLSELNSEETNVELIRNATSVLAEKDPSIAQKIDVESSYKEFVDNYSQTPPLYDEVLSQMDASTDGCMRVHKQL